MLESEIAFADELKDPVIGKNDKGQKQNAVSVLYKFIEAIEMANDSPYGLQAAVFTKDISRAFDIAYQLEAGGVMVNWSSALRAENLPFGGVKMSGNAREGLHDTLNEMTEQKVILVHNALRQ